MVKPIRPSDVVGAKTAGFPPEVLEAFNELITVSYANGRAIVRQNQVVESILAKMPLATRAEVFGGGWLDVERTYEEAGWSVRYDKPVYCETYEPTFTFTVKTP